MRDPEIYVQLTEVRNPSGFLDRFEQFRKEVKRCPAEIPNKAIDKIVTSTGDCQELFDIARSAWKELGAADHIIRVIEDVKSPDAKVAKKAYKELTLIRKQGGVLSTAWVLFDASHRVPETHYLLQKLLGRVKDWYTTPDYKKYVAAIREVLTDRVQDSVAFQPCAPKSFLTTLQSILDNMTGLTSAKQMTTVKFHHGLRKDGTRHVSNLFQLAAVRQRNPDFTSMYVYIAEVNHYLGEQHDQVIANELEGKKVLSMSIDDWVQKRVKKFSKVIKKSWL